jgi:uncharacterized protein
MFRALVYAFLAILVLTAIRMFARIVTKGMGEIFEASNPPAQKPNPPPASGPLKRDPVCGTYVPADNSVRKTVEGEILYFCSPECRDKYPG